MFIGRSAKVKFKPLHQSFYAKNRDAEILKHEVEDAFGNATAEVTAQYIHHI